MSVLSRPKLASELRRLCDSVHSRLWIASPYVGAWEVRRVLGRAWWDGKKVDTRLLTDPDERQINRETALRFAEKGKIKKLRGLHAKLFIVDDEVLITSANLTYAAFARRHEVGLILKGESAQSVVTLFESWWDRADDFPKESVLGLPKKSLATAGEDDGKPGLPDAIPLPPDPGNFGGQHFISLFGDYPEFLACYRKMVEVYRSLRKRMWPEVPLYLETDAFLDYLYHHGEKPSKKFARGPAKQLTLKEQQSKIRRYARKFQSWARGREEGRRGKEEQGRAKEDRKRRSTNPKVIRRLLSTRNLGRLDRTGITDVASRLNCMTDKRVLNRFLDSSKNRTQKVRKAWGTLLHADHMPPTEEMTACALSLHGFKRSSVQELLGWYRPNDFPLRNRNVNAGLRFLGYDVRPT